MLETKLSDRPPGSADGQQPTRPTHLLVLLGERPDRTRRLPTQPGPLPPHQAHRPTETRRIDQDHRPAAMAGGDHPTPPAPLDGGRRLHRHRQPAAPTIVGIGVAGDADHMQAGQPHEQVTVGTVGLGARAAAHTARRLRHRRGPYGTGSWSFLILRTPTPTSPHPPHRRVAPAPTASTKSRVSGSVRLRSTPVRPRGSRRRRRRRSDSRTPSHSIPRATPATSPGINHLVVEGVGVGHPVRVSLIKMSSRAMSCWFGRLRRSSLVARRRGRGLRRRRVGRRGPRIDPWTTRQRPTRRKS